MAEQNAVATQQQNTQLSVTVQILSLIHISEPTRH